MNDTPTLNRDLYARRELSELRDLRVGFDSANDARLGKLAEAVHRYSARATWRAVRDPFLVAASSPEVSAWCNYAARRYLFGSIPEELRKFGATLEQDQKQRALTSEDSSMGQATVPPFIAGLVYDLLYATGEWRNFGVQPVGSGQTKFVTCTAAPTAGFIMTEGDGLTPDTTLAGTSVSPACKTAGCLIDISEELLADQKVDLTAVLLRKIVEAINYRIDYCCLSGSGAADADNGGITGIFQSGSVNPATAGAGNTTLETLDENDFLRAFETVSAPALQRGCRWWLHSSLFPKLLRCRDASGARLVKMPPEAPGFYLLGHPISLTAGAPSTNAAGTKVLAFGYGQGFAVAVRDEFEVGQGIAQKFNQLIRQLRVLTRVGGALQDTAAFVTVKTAAT